MDKAKRSRLQDAEWRLGGAAEFLNLPRADALFSDVRARLALELAARRSLRDLTQAELAELIHSSKPVARGQDGGCK